MTEKHFAYATQYTRQQLEGERYPQRAEKGNRSTMSKFWKTPKQKRAAVERNNANRTLRASLHSQRAFETNIDRRAAIQSQIDQIGAGGQVNG